MKKRFPVVLAILAVASMLMSCAAPVAPTVAPAAPVPAEATAAPAAAIQAPATSAPVAPAATSASAPAAQPAGNVDWTAYQGTTIRVLMDQHPIADVIKKLQPDFEKLTGITINMEVYPESQYREKLKIEMLAGNKDLDVIWTALSQEGQQFYDSGWYTDLQPFIDNPKLTASDYGWPSDYPDVDIPGSQINGVQVSIPLDRLLPPIVYYRKDLFEQYGIPTPKTLDDLEAAAKTIFEKSDGKIYGMANRGKGSVTTSQFRSVLFEFGGMWNDESGRPTVDTPEAIAAIDWWGRTLRLYGPPGTTNYDWYEVVNDFQQGVVGISLEGALNAGVLEDPAKSKVVGKVGYLPMLPGPGGGDKMHHFPPPSQGQFIGLAIPSFSTKKEAAWLFLQYMTNKEAGLQYLLAGKQSARKSAWEDPRFLSTTNQDWVNAMITAATYSYPTQCYAPCSIKDVTQARDIIGKAIVASILGEDVKAAATTAEADLVALWQKEQSGTK